MSRRGRSRSRLATKPPLAGAETAAAPASALAESEAASIRELVPVMGARVMLRSGGGQRGRKTSDFPAFSATPGSLVALPDYESEWRDLNLDSRTLDRMRPDELLERLCSLSPDISRAVWDFQRMSNPGWEVKCFKPNLLSNSQTNQRFPEAEAAVAAFLLKLKELYGSPDVIFNRLFMSAFVRGGIFAEIVLDARAKEPVDLVTPDPRFLQWKKVDDPVRGSVWIPVQWGENGKWVELDLPTVRYIPIDPLPNRPYGRPIAGSALFTTLFVLSLLHDLRRVVAQQGYPRIDIEVDIDGLLKVMPPEVMRDAKLKKKWVDEILDSIKNSYAQLQPEDAYAHLSTIKLNRPIGTVDADSLAGIPGILQYLDRQTVRGVKSMPLLFGISEATTETHATRQWAIYAKGIKSLQHLAEHLLEHLFQIALRAQGVQATVEFRFAELRDSEMLRDEQVQQMKLINAWFAYMFGLIDIDESAQQSLGRLKADQRKPRGDPGKKPTSDGASGPDPSNPSQNPSSSDAKKEDSNGWHREVDENGDCSLVSTFGPWRLSVPSLPEAVANAENGA